MEMSNNVSTVSYASTQGSVASQAPKAEPAVKQVISEETVAAKPQDNSGVASNSALKKAVETINKSLGNSEAVFGIHEETNRLTVKIVDKETKEIIKEYPAEETLDMIARVWEQAGIMLDEKR